MHAADTQMLSFSVAPIGPDASGKTTISSLLQQRHPGTFKYLYMSINAESANVSLPTTRLREWIKKNVERSKTQHSVSTDKRVRPKGRVWSAFRLMNRIAEEIFRHSLARWYVGRGFIVLHDRHYKFDFACDAAELASLPVAERLHRKWLSRLYP